MFKYMDHTELAISSIKDLRMVHFYHLSEEGKAVPAALAYYDNDKTINLCMLDKHFDRLIAKLVEVYEQEYESNTIIADVDTQRILNNAVVDASSGYKKLIEGMSELTEPYCYHKGYMKIMILPIIRYLIDSLYGVSENRLIWNPVYKEWFGSGVLTAICGDESLVFPFKVNTGEKGRYVIEVGNVLASANKLNAVVEYTAGGVKIVFDSASPVTEGYIEYTVLDSVLYVEEFLSMDGREICKKREKVEPVATGIKSAGAEAAGDGSRSADVETAGTAVAIERYIAGITTDSVVYSLPWGQKLICETKVRGDEESSVKRRTTAYVSYEQGDSSAWIISDDVLSASGKVSFTIKNFAIDAYESERYGRMQMHFIDTGYETRGYYRKKLSDKYMGRLV